MSSNENTKPPEGPPPGYYERDATVEDYMELFDIDRDAAIFMWNDQRKQAIEMGQPVDKIYEPIETKK